MKDIFQILDGIDAVLGHGGLTGNPRAEEQIIVTLTLERNEFGESIHQIKSKFAFSDNMFKPVEGGYRLRWKGTVFYLKRIEPRITFKDHNSFY